MIIKRGTYQIIRVDGSEETIEQRPYIQTICKQIGCDTIDTVTLDRQHQTVMMVDDTGMVDGRPVNPKATALYLSICKPNTIWSIHGDVAIVNDEDFA